MGEEPKNPEVNQEELAYYRAVEDHFCRLRGTPFLFSPKDFAYLRKWWQEGVPLSAVLLGLGEVFARRRLNGQDPVSSLAYCRHAVARHAKHLAQARVGDRPPVPIATEKALARLEAGLQQVQKEVSSPRLKEVLASCLAALGALPQDLPPAALSEILAELEEQTLRAAWGSLEEGERQALQAAVLEDLPQGQELSARAFQVALLAAVREFLHLPRLELVPDEP